MGKRGPKKGTCYKQNGIIDEVKIAIHRYNNPNATWTETARLIHPDSEEYSYCDFKNTKVKPVKRIYKKFETVFSELGQAKAKEWEKLINGGRKTEPLWKFTPEDKDNFRITFKNSDWWYVFSKDESKAKWNEVSSFLLYGTIADWMIENPNIDRKELLKVWERLVRENRDRETILKLRGEDHLHVVSIDGEKAELWTGKKLFYSLNQRHNDAVEMIMASMEKDKKSL